MPKHQPTPEQLERLQRAHLDVSVGEADVAEARAKLSQAIADQSERTMALSRAIDDVLYGPKDEPHGQSEGNLRDLSNDLAREHWPSPPPGGGG
ncbi:hypothetical protein [Streptomyces sp. Z26]|uniref:hypothetical protein n=1 Tax=Streptomyces sp. Z26 TaxID=2500177 RepID=UPI000EF14920|nr:hypothetical protein [Streptomyces sp. Z26]RLL68143.1 hypothetical protein D7M15_16310 [Streptomyces sp. Z26]